MKKTTLLQAIIQGAKIAANATYDGKVTIEESETTGYYTAEYTNQNSHTPKAKEIYSFNTSPYEKESAAALIKEARASIKI